MTRPRHRLLLPLACAALAWVGCKKPPPPPTPVKDAGVVDAGSQIAAEERARLESTLQQALAGTPCPAGAKRVGAEPPDGRETWCERDGPDGKAVRDGPYEAWHDNGVKAISGAYKDGARDGRWLLWHENGQRKQEVTYVKGKPDGVFREWDERGETLADVRYKNGKLVK